MKIALLGYGSVGKALARLLRSKRSVYPFPIVGIHTAKHGSALNPKGLGLNPSLAIRPPRWMNSCGDFAYSSGVFEKGAWDYGK